MGRVGATPLIESLVQIDNTEMRRRRRVNGQAAEAASCAPAMGGCDRPPEQADGVGAPGEVAPDVLVTGSDDNRKRKRKRKAAPLEQR